MPNATFRQTTEILQLFKVKIVKKKKLQNVHRKRLLSLTRYEFIRKSAREKLERKNEIAEKFSKQIKIDFHFSNHLRNAVYHLNSNFNIHSHVKFRFKVLECLMKGKWIFGEFSTLPEMISNIFPFFPHNYFALVCLLKRKKRQSCFNFHSNLLSCCSRFNGYWQCSANVFLLMCENHGENCVREFNGTSKTKVDRYVASALNTIITFNSDRMRIYDFYVLLLRISVALLRVFFAFELLHV